MANRNKYIILTTLLLQSIILLIFNLIIMGSESLLTLKRNVPIINIVILFTTVFMLISFKKTDIYAKKEIELELLKENMKNIEELLTLLRSQRHDYLSHIQSIGALLYLEEYQELRDYMQGISSEYRFTSEIVRLGNPTLTVLLNTKKELAESKGISFYTNCNKKVVDIQINPSELSSLLSNLIENAIEAASDCKGGKWIKFSIDYMQENYIFKIENSGYIDANIFNQLTQPGISSKKAAGRGYGLYIASNITRKNNGSLTFKNTTNNSVEFLVSLPEKGAIHDQEYVQ